MILDIVYFATLSACMLLVAFFAIVRTVSEPRAAFLGDVMGARLGALREAYLALPAPQRVGYLEEVASLAGNSLALDDPSHWRLIEPENVLTQAVLRQVHTLLPDAVIAFSDGDDPQVWFALPAADSGLFWLRVPVVSIPDDTMTLLATYLVAVSLVVMLGMLYLGWRSRHEIRDAGRALGTLDVLVGSGTAALNASAPGGHTSLPPGRSLDALVAAMSQRLTQMRHQRGQVLQEAAAELRRAVGPWTQCAQVLGRDARACSMVMQLERVAAQFEHFAHDWSAESPVLADLCALVERVVGSTSPGVTLAMAPLPPLMLRPQAMEQLLAQLLDNALSHGGGRVVVTAAQEGEELVLRVLDRGEPVDSQALVMIGRPFFCGDAVRQERLAAGLGVATAQLIAQLHGGALRVDRRIGGGLIVELRLPLVRREGAVRHDEQPAGLGCRRPVWVAILGDVLLLVALFAAAVSLSSHLFNRIVGPAYISSAVHVLAGEVEGIGAGYAALPPSLRPAYLEALSRYSEGRVRVADPAGFALGPARLQMLRTFVEHLRGRLPGVSIQVSPWPQSLLWIEMPVKDEAAPWLALSARPYASGMLPAWGAMSLLLVACAWLLVLRARRRLAQGVFQLSAPGQLPDIECGDGDSMERQILELKRRFDQVSESLVQATHEQESLLHQFTRDLRDHLARLRGAGERLPLDAVPLEGIVRAVERLEQLACRTPDRQT